MEELLTIDDVLTLSGAILAVTVITNGINYAFRLPSKYVALVFSFLMALTSAILTGNVLWPSIIVTIANTFLIYVGAVGISTVAHNSSSEQRRKATSMKENIVEPNLEEIPNVLEMTDSKIFWSNWF